MNAIPYCTLSKLKKIYKLIVTLLNKINVNIL